MLSVDDAAWRGPRRVGLLQGRLSPQSCPWSASRHLCMQRHSEGAPCFAMQSVESFV